MNMPYLFDFLEDDRRTRTDRDTADRRDRDTD